MDTIQTGVVTLLKSAVTGERLNLPADFDLQAAYPIIKRHHMAAVIYEGALKCEISPDLPIMNSLLNVYLKTLQISLRQMKALDRLLKAFSENDIRYLPVKGCVMKALYPKPELRIMGDADLLIQTQQYARIVPIMKENGFEEGEEGEKHFIWKSDALTVELHKGLFSPGEAACYRFFGSGWQHAHVESGSRYGFDDETMYAFLFAHFANHFASEGIGCRHVMDLWVYRNAHPRMDEKRIEAMLCRMKLGVFHKNILKMLSVWFEGASPDPLSELLTNTIFSNGSWGSVKNRILREGVSDMGGTNAAAVSRAKYILRCIFPGADRLKKQYPAAGRHPWLLPGAWFVRLITKILSPGSVVKSHKKKLELLDKSALASEKALLDSVGLNNFD